MQDNSYPKPVFDEVKYANLNPMQRYVYLREFMAAMEYKTNVAWNREQGMAEGKLRLLFSQIQKRPRKARHSLKLPAIWKIQELIFSPFIKLCSSIRILQLSSWPIYSQK